MSHLLWRCYYNDDVDKFKSLLASGHHGSHHAPKGHGGASTYNSGLGISIGSPGAGFGTSPRMTAKGRKSSGQSGTAGNTKEKNIPFSRAEINGRDNAGLTILHRAVSSTSSNAIDFALALIDHPNIDLHVQDKENGWTALHRALYFGNITIARALMDRDTKNSIGQGTSNTVLRSSGLIKVKDFEGNSPFDVYNATVARRGFGHDPDTAQEGSEEEEGGSRSSSRASTRSHNPDKSGIGEEVFVFGSNKNLTLGFGDQDDRQHPEKITLKRPDHLLLRFYQEHLEASDVNLQKSNNKKRVSDLPDMIKHRPIFYQDVCLSKFHSAILTTDPESNLYMCGFGAGGRLGTGDETSRFSYVCVEGGGLAGQKITAVALGQNHTMAVTSEGGILTWGINSWGQLGYNLPRPSNKDEEPFNSTPRQLFGPLKRERVVGVAASAVHSVAFTATSLYTWGKNEGQLGLMDSDSRSLEVQTVPRRVAASLFTSPIHMVSAINSATVCLLENKTVWVFTNYGYNNIKFSGHSVFSDYRLNVNTSVIRGDPSEICQITSGGDTIAAISSRGDLYTMNVSEKPDASSTAASTTNPTKIRNALSPPQVAWTLRKGHWDGVKSVGVSENGSVILCTQAGAVWRRIKRPKIKHAFASGTGEFKSKDYKFQRVPGLTKVAGVRCNIFGGYAAIRKDSDVTRTELLVRKQTIWKDVESMLSLRDLEASEPTGDKEATNEAKFWRPALSREHFGPLHHAVLVSNDIEGEVDRHIKNNTLNDQEYDFMIRTSLSNIGIPVHGFILAARSRFLRKALFEYYKNGSFDDEGTLSIMAAPDKGLPSITINSVDFITILNLVLYSYTDEIVEVWRFNHHQPDRAYLYRSIRTELMKLAGKLGMTSLESCVRIIAQPRQQLHVDMAEALNDPLFFEECDAIAELDGGEMPFHSALLRQRCPFFEGLFNGRSGGQWLAARREMTGPIKVDMKHIDPTIFALVLHYLYADCGTEMFDGFVSDDFEGFCDVVMDVLSVANELMLDRLSDICQKVLGRYVDTRNACYFINSIAPCSVTKFKELGFEYICLQLEAFLENHLLDELDEDLMLELDEIVRSNQLASLPFSKSGRADILLHERHPSLAGDADEERQRLVRDMIFRTRLKDESSRLSSSFRTGSLDEKSIPFSSQDKQHRKGRDTRNAPFSPAIRPKDSVADLMFDMDDEDGMELGGLHLPKQRPSSSPLEGLSGSATPVVVKGQSRQSSRTNLADIENSPFLSPIIPPSSLKSSLPNEQLHTLHSDGEGGKPWSSPSQPTSIPRFDLREIMAQASTSRTSALSASLSAQRSREETSKVSTPKISQKERKRQQQEQHQALQKSASKPMPQTGSEMVSPSNKSSSPWQAAATGPKISLKDIFDANNKDSASDQRANLLSKPKAHEGRRTASPDTRFPGQQRSSSYTSVSKVKPPPSSPVTRPSSSTPTQAGKQKPLVPHSKSYNSPPSKAEPSLQLSMTDIIGQQRREQDLVKEAVAKRSLQEIQEEQAFQEWWDQESRRTQEEEAQRLTGGPSSSTGDSGAGRGKGAKRGRGGALRGRGDNSARGRGRGRGSNKNPTTA